MVDIDKVKPKGLTTNTDKNINTTATTPSKPSKTSASTNKPTEPTENENKESFFFPQALATIL
eukprot:Ihof_evm10s36 gene=Ihof_evmTU10s36